MNFDLNNSQLAHFQVEPYKTGAVAPEAAKRVVGKLPKERIPVVKKEEVRVILLPSASIFLCPKRPSDTRRFFHSWWPASLSQSTEVGRS